MIDFFAMLADQHVEVTVADEAVDEVAASLAAVIEGHEDVDDEATRRACHDRSVS